MSAEGSRESLEGWDEVMRGHVEQRGVTANLRAPLRMDPHETKGNKAMKHKHKPPRAHSVTSETFYDGGDVGPRYAAANRARFFTPARARRGQ